MLSTEFKHLCRKLILYNTSAYKLCKQHNFKLNVLNFNYYCTAIKGYKFIFIRIRIIIYN